MVHVKPNGYIYAIKNIQNNKLYIGSTNNFVLRKDTHLYKLRHNDHHCSHLQNAWNKYGANSFEFIILEKFENISRSDLYKIEQTYLTQHAPEYNSVLKTRGFAEATRQRKIARTVAIFDSFNFNYDLDKLILYLYDIEYYLSDLLDEGKIYPSEYYEIADLIKSHFRVSHYLEDNDYEDMDIVQTALTEKCYDCQFANFNTNCCNIQDVKNKCCPNEYEYR
jgi:predicted GIY-YIG superfamily endonuclease